MKILVVFTGGTIGSFYDGGYISSDRKRPYKLLEMYNEKFPNDIKWDTANPYTILSENLDGKHLLMLSGCIKEALTKEYDGIIVTHGSDTLQYSASFLSYVTGLETIPVVLVAANYVLEDERSNGLANFAGAVEFIKRRGGNGVFVSYANSGEICRIHRGTRLMPHVMYRDYLYSVSGRHYCETGKDAIIKNPAYSEVMNNYIYEVGDDFATGSGVVWINEHPGIVLPEISDDVKTVMISSYHSGTLSTGSRSFKDWLGRIRDRNIPVYLAGQTEGPDYETCSLYRELGIKTLPEMSPVSAYVRLWLENSGGSHFDMEESVAGDICL